MMSDGALESEAAIQAVNDALDSFVPLIVRRNKSRAGDQWEVVQGPPEDEPITDGNVRVLGAYPTSIEAHTVAEKRNSRSSAIAVIRAIARTL